MGHNGSNNTMGAAIDACPIARSLPIKRFNRYPLSLWLLVTVLLTACEPAPPTEYAPRFSGTAPRFEQSFSFGVHPLHNPQRLLEVFGPVMDRLEARIPGAHFRLEASRNYAAFDDKLYSRKFDFALPNPYQTIKAIQHGYRVFAKVGVNEDFRGIILVRRDGPIHELMDLRGKSMSFPAPTALAASMMPQHFLATHGIDPQHDIQSRYVGSQESSIMSVYLGKTDAAATWPPPWRRLSSQRPELAQALVVKWQTAPLPNNGVVASDEIPDTLVDQVLKVLCQLHRDPAGRKILAAIGWANFEPADANTFQPVRDFMADFDGWADPVNGGD